MGRAPPACVRVCVPVSHVRARACACVPRPPQTSVIAGAVYGLHCRGDCRATCRLDMPLWTVGVCGGGGDARAPSAERPPVQKGARGAGAWWWLLRGGAVCAECVGGRGTRPCAAVLSCRWEGGIQTSPRRPRPAAARLLLYGPMPRRGACDSCPCSSARVLSRRARTPCHDAEGPEGCTGSGTVRPVPVKAREWGARPHARAPMPGPGRLRDRAARRSGSGGGSGGLMVPHPERAITPPPPQHHHN